MVKRDKKEIFFAVLIIGLLLFGAFTFGAYQKNRQFEIERQTYESTLKLKDSLSQKYISLFYADSLFLIQDYDAASMAYKDVENKYPNLIAFVAIKQLDLLEKISSKTVDMTNNRIAFANEKNNARTEITTSSKSAKDVANQKDLQSAEIVQTWKDSVDNLKNEVEKLKSNSNGFLKFSTSKNDEVNYVGQVKDGKANGKGVGLWSTGGKYDGEWVNNKRQGRGTYTWADGDVYEGEFYMDKRNGNGKYKWKEGEYYIGGWKDDKRNGEGILYNKNNKIKFNGMWNNDEFKK